MEIGNIPPGSWKKVKFSAIALRRYRKDEIPFLITVREKRVKQKREKQIILALNSFVPTLQTVELIPKHTPLSSPPKLALWSDVDKKLYNIKVSKKDKNKWAAVIGIEGYMNAPSATYAKQDALAMREYFIKVMGVPKRHLFFLYEEEATKASIDTLISDRLKRKIKQSDELYFYFAGHGISDIQYILPYDGYPDSPQTSAISVKDLF